MVTLRKGVFASASIDLLPNNSVYVKKELVAYFAIIVIQGAQVAVFYH